MISPDLHDPRVRIVLLIVAAAAIVALLIPLLSGGDGPPSESERVGGIVSEFVLAGNERDFATVCSLLSDEARGEIERFAERLALRGEDACERALTAQAGETIGNQTVEVFEVRIVGDRAAVDVATEDPESGRSERTLQLVKDKASGEWKVAKFG